MFNTSKDKWSFIKNTQDFPRCNEPVWILVEYDVILELDSDVPHVRKACLIKTSVPCYDIDKSGNVLGTNNQDYYFWKLLDYDPDEEEEVLQQCFTVIAYRYMNG